MTSTARQFEQAEQRTEFYTVRCDVELTRIALGLHLSNLHRLWLIARAGDVPGSGIANRRYLYDALPGFGIDVAPDYYRKLIAAGEGLYWRRQGDELALVGIQNVAQKLIALAHEDGLDKLFQTNRPGDKRDMYVDVAGDVEHYEANVYGAWHAAHECPRISRDNLEKLFNRDADTLRNWERKYLKHRIEVRFQYTSTTTPDVHLPPEHAYHEGAHTIWQTVNQYIPHMVRQHPRRGMSRKVRGKANAAVSLIYPAEGHRKKQQRIYFDDAEKLDRAMKRHQGIDRLVYLFKRVNNAGHNTYSAALLTNDLGALATNSTPYPAYVGAGVRASVNVPVRRPLVVRGQWLERSLVCRALGDSAIYPEQVDQVVARYLEWLSCAAPVVADAELRAIQSMSRLSDRLGYVRRNTVDDMPRALCDLDPLVLFAVRLGGQVGDV